MTGYARGIGRLVVLGVVTVFLLGIVALGKVIAGISGGSPVYWKNRFTRAWARSASVIIGMKLEVKGTPPKPPFFLVSNHLSYVDILPIWRTVPASFVAKREVRGWPVLGSIIAFVGTLFIDRNNKRDLVRANREISERIGNNEGIVLFPEGTSSKGKRVLPFMPPLLYYPARTKTPVYYASISYHIPGHNKSAAKTVCWWGSMAFAGHFLNLLKTRSFNATIEFCKEPVVGVDRKKLAGELHQLISKQFKPVV